MKLPHTKRPFDTKEDCEANIAANDIGVKLYAYLCYCGKWHKTKHAPERWKQIVASTDRHVAERV